jgi:hypothetical protein
LKLAPPMVSLIGDKGYDGDGFRAEIVNRGAKPVIPNKSNRVTLHDFSKGAYKGRIVSSAVSVLKDSGGSLLTNLPATSWLPSTSPPSSTIGSIESEP